MVLIIMTHPVQLIMTHDVLCLIIMTHSLQFPSGNSDDFMGIYN